MVTQIFFTLLGPLLRLHGVGDGGIASYILCGLAVAVLASACFFGSRWLASGVKKGPVRLGRSFEWTATANVTGLHDALIGCYRSPSWLAWAALSDMISWLLGGVGVCFTRHVLGNDVGSLPGFIIDSLGQALKAVGFAVHAALGVQEGGYNVIFQVFGLSPEMAIALSLMKRLREVALGAPGLLACHRAEARPITVSASPMQGGIS